MIEILVLAIVAFIIYKKLISVLGNTKYDNELSSSEKDKFEEFKKSISNIIEPKEESSKIIDIASGLEASLSESDRQVFDAIRKNDPSMTAEKFIKGAKTAFEMIINAHSQGDRASLKQLLDPELYDSFNLDISNNEASNQLREVTIVAIKECNIKSASLSNRNKIATINVHFISEQIKVIRDKLSREIIDGNPSKIILASENWSFAKDIGSGSNIWKLIAVNSDA
jgi:predicted lipid-binding transport protein (Tim44 family)